MKNVIRKIRAREGFSLVELMIVVAIIGVLVAVAVPNFQKFLARAKQTEAKTNLGSLYGAHKAFHGEWNMYTGSFLLSGFNPEGQLRYRINNGGPGPALPNNYPNQSANGVTAAGVLQGEAVPVATNTYCLAAINASACAEVLQYAVAPAVAATVAPTAVVFTAQASSNLDGDGDVDSWTIDQGKIIINNVTDL